MVNQALATDCEPMESWVGLAYRRQAAQRSRFASDFPFSCPVLRSILVDGNWPVRDGDSQVRETMDRRMVSERMRCSPFREPLKPESRGPIAEDAGMTRSNASHHEAESYVR